MKPEEVLDNINNKILIQGRRNGRYLETETMKVIIEALEKQIPMKPDITLHNWHCGNCHNAWGRERVITESHSRFEYFQYCPTCGQRIDWGEVE